MALVGMVGVFADKAGTIKTYSNLYTKELWTATWHQTNNDQIEFAISKSENGAYVFLVNFISDKITYNSVIPSVIRVSRNGEGMTNIKLENWAFIGKTGLLGLLKIYQGVYPVNGELVEGLNAIDIDFSGGSSVAAAVSVMLQ